jgi:hypothetical protein
MWRCAKCGATYENVVEVKNERDNEEKQESCDIYIFNDHTDKTFELFEQMFEEGGNV